MVTFILQELNNYLTVTTSTAVIVDKSTDGDFLRIDFNMSFPSLPCEFASIDVSNVLGTVSYSSCQFLCSMVLLE
ncbi:hypothetical protein CISIN_1g034822mg [Citrus sinensis]|uniref:Endoplasmic reticulum vesicle transporter N-terminal domain-containing protein n=1 Tax=Citrus sinensis TaxID=2711 RepID=A0A067DH96_CITSI|nr:hypothetical protein CISIN_1g034822mg [Citrus sinensis]